MLIKMLVLCVVGWSITGSPSNTYAQQQQGSTGQAVERQTATQPSVQQPQQSLTPRDADTTPRVALVEQAVASDVQGRALLQARLLTTELRATPDAPLRNVRISIENPTASAYTYVSGWVTFYNAQGVRCGEGLWTLNALAPGESAETDAPGLRLTNTPVAWRIAVLSSIGGTGNPGSLLSATSTPQQLSGTLNPLPPTTPTEAVTSAVAAQRLEININGERFTVQAGQTLELEIGKERVRIVATTIP